MIPQDNYATFSCSHIFEEGLPILHVVCDHDGDIQVLCGVHDHADSRPRIVGWGCACERDPSLRELAGLQPGTALVRSAPGQPWSLEGLADEEESAVNSPGLIRPPDMPAFTRYIENAVRELEVKQEQMDAAYRAGSYPRYDYDSDTGRFIWSRNGVPQVSARFEIVGSFSPISDTWLWAWANSSVGRPKETMLPVKQFGEAHGYARLVQAGWTAREEDGWEMAAVAAKLLNAQGAYRAPDGGPVTFLLLFDLAWVT